MQKRITREPLSEQIKGHRITIDNQMYIDVVGEKMIKTAFLRTQATTMYTVGCRSVYSDFILFLQEQIRIKDRQNTELKNMLKMQKKQSNYTLPKMRVYRKKKLPKPKGMSVPMQRLFEGAKQSQKPL